MPSRDYEYGRRCILARLRNAQNLLLKTTPEQVNLRAKLVARIGIERKQLERWEAENQPKPEPLDGNFYEGPTRQVCGAA